jgi:hypothetical protein
VQKSGDTVAEFIMQEENSIKCQQIRLVHIQVLLTILNSATESSGFCTLQGVDIG